MTTLQRVKVVVILGDMGNRFVEERLTRANISFSEMWGSEHEGRFWKRKLSKARRRASKRLCRYGEDDLSKVERGLPQIERICHWKNW
jgi:hypothetical protein